MQIESLGLGAWVETHTDTRRGGQPFTVAVNRRSSSAILLDDDMPIRELESALREGGFLDASPAPVPAPRVGRLRRAFATFDVHWTGADRLVVAVHRRMLARAWRRRWLVVQVAIAIAGSLALSAALLSGRPLELRPSPWHVPFYIAISLMSVAVHELGHAVVLSHNGRRVASVGIRLHLGSPAFYVESVEAFLLPRRQRLVQAAAGPWAEWQFVSLVAIVLWATPGLVWTPVLHRFVVLAAFTIATNLLPFAGLDGSLILADLVREPNLAADSKDAVRRFTFDRRSGDTALVAYAVVNTIVSSALLLTGLALWYFVFGDMLGALLELGPIGWTGATLLLGVSFGPALVAGSRHLRRITPIDRIAFRCERRTRVRHAERFASVSPFDQLDAGALGVLAGQLRLHRVGRGAPVHAPAFRGYVSVEGDVTLGGDVTVAGGGVHRIDGSGATVTTRRWFRSASAALLADRAVSLVQPGPNAFAS